LFERIFEGHSGRVVINDTGEAPVQVRDPFRLDTWMTGFDSSYATGYRRFAPSPLSSDYKEVVTTISTLSASDCLYSLYWSAYAY
jgi:hypothetical protein